MQNSLIKLPSDIQSTLYLIREELKSRRLFHLLNKVGIINHFLIPHLDNVILHSLGLNDGTDETYKVYDSIMESRSKKIKASLSSITKQSLKAYWELSQAKKEISIKLNTKSP